jgi:hypothetical protein
LNRSLLAATMDQIATGCSPTLFASRAKGSSGSHLPVLIVGMPRSGSTLLEQILSSHPEIGSAGELFFWHPHGLEWGRAGLRHLNPQHLGAIGDDYVRLLRASAPNALRVIDKNLLNFQWLGLIWQAFPNARFIHCRRHPVDTCLSIYFTLFMLPQDYMSDRGDLAFCYRQYERLMGHWRRVLPPDRFIEVDYQALVEDREREARRLIAFCGLDWDDACLKHEANRRPVRTASVWQARQPIYRSSLERWRRYEPWLGELRQLLPQTTSNAEGEAR